MIKYLGSLSVFLLIGVAQAGNNDKILLTVEDLSGFSIQDQRLFKSTYPELVKSDNAVQGTSEVATIGPPGCDFNSSIRATPIQDAIDWNAVTYTELRIVEGVYDEENITLDDRDMVIKGGYATCSDAANDIQSSPDSLNTIIQSSNNGNPVFRITGNTSSNYISFHNITIQNSGSSIWYGGAIRVDNADVNVSINDTALKGNQALSGGAVAVIGTAETFVAFNRVEISNNSAEEGGGLFCNNTNAQLTINASEGLRHGVFSNTATAGDGGGALIESGCHLTTYQGTKDLNLFGDDMRGFSFNSATGHGGALAVRSSGSANLYGRTSCAPFNEFWLCLLGNNTEPVSMFFNIADSDDSASGHGGAIYVTDLGSEVLAENVYLAANLSENGGAVASESLAEVTIRTAFENEAGAISCWQPDACVDINSNLASGNGGGFYTSSSGEIEATNFQARNNRANLGVVGYGRDNNSTLRIEGGLIYNNGNNANGSYSDRYLFRVFQDSNLYLYNSTIADNNIDSNYYQVTNNDAYVSIVNSIIYDPIGAAIYSETGNNNPRRFLNCLVVHENQSFWALGASSNYLGDPEFVDSSNQNYQLSDGSPAIDRCDLEWITPTAPDLLGNLRGFDVAGIPDDNTPYDVGAYEKVSSDIIFKHGFE